jgi:serine/threonine-protein kinase
LWTVAVPFGDDGVDNPSSHPNGWTSLPIPGMTSQIRAVDSRSSDPGMHTAVDTGRLPRMVVAQVLGDRYEVTDLIGNGGMAVVCRAHDRVLGRTVAVKLLAGRHAGDPESRRRIREEARAAATLSHPNIAQVYDYGESDDDGTCVPYVVMELVRGGTLQARLDAGPVPPRFAMRVGAEVAAALAAAHADGLVHRDIKPANVMVTPGGVKVVDFGIAAAIGTAGSGDPDGEVLGTPAYVAPERLLDDVTEPASDIYALGVLLYQMLSGHSPWSADTTTQMLAAHIYIEPTPLPQLPEVPPYITALCNRCLAKDPTQRPSAREAAALLAQGAGMRVVDDLPPLAAPGGPSTDREPSVLLPRARPAAGAVAGAWATDETGVREPDAADPLVRPAAGEPLLRPAATGPADPLARRAAGEPPRRGPAAPRPGPDADAPRRRRIALLVAAAVLGLAGLALWFLLPGGPPEPTSAAAPPAASGPAGEAPEGPAPGPSGGTPDDPAAPGRGLAPGPDTGTALPGVQTGGAAGEGTPTTRPAGTEPVGPGPGPGTTTEPGEPDPDQTTPPEDEEEPPQERTLSSSAGSVRATCPSPRTAEVLDYSATRPYQVEAADTGPGSAPYVLFKRGNETVEMVITCSGGVPSADVREN